MADYFNKDTRLGRKTEGIFREERKNERELGRFLACTIFGGTIGGLTGAVYNYNVQYDTLEHEVNYCFEVLPFVVAGLAAGAILYGADRLIRKIINRRKLK